MNKQIYIVESTADLPQIAQKIISLGKNKSNIWLFNGEMAAGKTTTIKAIAQTLGVRNHVQSPTFSIVNEYICNDDTIIYHFDCYRLKNEEEALGIGIEEYLDSGRLCLIEWPDKIVSLLPQDTFRISIETLPNDFRRFELE